MGNVMRSFKKANRSMQILVLGLDDAGKTTMLNNLRKSCTVETVPTVGFNVEKLTYKKITINVWDVGGQETIRNLWKHYYVGTNALIFVVDSSNVVRLPECMNELHRTINDPELHNVPFLIFANKLDCPNACPKEKLIEELGLNEISGRRWIVIPSCAKTGQGLEEGLDWIAAETESTANTKKGG